MKPLGLNEIREKFLTFFESKGHLRLKSFPLIPQNDKSLLIINSGMAPMKAYFTGLETPPSKRVTTCQKCVRTVDIENVGVTARHCTLFEMLGNFSFGDYFKEEIIPWAWEFTTEVLELPAERVYVTVYEEDDEALAIWRDKVGVPANRVVKLGKKDNFWEHGLGPCGPCSELHYDRGEEYGCGKPECAPGCDCDRFMEFWNLVFTQFSLNEDGTYSKLASTNIDTGMGLERMAVIMQGADTVFDVDTFKVVRDAVCKRAGVNYGADAKSDKSIRIVTEHIRSVTFMLADGILPSNEGRGYVLRRLLRRAARHVKLLGISEMFLTDVCGAVIKTCSGAYPELAEKKDYIYKLLSIEEENFYKTLDQGTEILKQNIEELRASGKTELSGANAFRLYDTYGFPLPLTLEILEEEGFTVDESGFTAEMERQRKRGRDAREQTTYMGADETAFDTLSPSIVTRFTGYTDLSGKSEILAIVENGAVVKEAEDGAEISIVTAQTPLYAEMGGQKGDRGVIKTETGEVQIYDCVKAAGGRFAQVGKVTRGKIFVSQTAEISADKPNRLAIARNHSATHLLHRALRLVLGAHVEQAGSYVSSERLRFDFTHFEPVSKENLAKAEQIVNGDILAALPVDITETTIAESKKMGATALFGEKYGDVVRVVKMGESVELCGGTHLSNTAQAGAFKIVSESGTAAGVRRIEAVTGHGALNYFAANEERLKDAANALKTQPEAIVKKIEQLQAQNRELTKENNKLRAELNGGVVENLLSKAVKVGETSVVTGFIDDADISELRDLSDKIKDAAKSAAIVLIGGKDGKNSLIVTATKDVVDADVNSGAVIKAVSAVMGGGGGGKPAFAQAGVSDLSKKEEAFALALELIKKALAGEK
ncbi:alanine--tRNA ligase [Clostridia bacterium]|nr:alanine--tRNA ligase [Clostridia bacterium]